MSAVLDAKPPRGAVGLEWLPVLAGLLVLYVPTFYGLATSIWQEDEYAHGPIILFVILWLIWQKRQLLLAAPIRTAPAPGLALLVIGLLLYVAGRSVSISIFEIGALTPIVAGTLLVMRGWQALRAFWFMLLFIAYLVPLPGIFVDALTGPLKQSVSTVAEQILYSTGYPIARDGVMLTIGQYQLLVADACSGLNSMFSLSAIGLLYLYLMRYKSWLHNGLILVSLLPIAFCANIVRVIILILITYHYGDAAGQGFLHGFSGMALFVIALIILLLLDAVLARVIKPRNPALSEHDKASSRTAAMSTENYIPPLRYKLLTRFYDPLVRWTTREAAFKRALLAQVVADRPHHVLDLGSGTGTLTIAIAKALPDAAVSGLDADAEALAIAAHKGQRAGVSLGLQQGFSTGMPFDDAQFDCVVSSLFFHHLTRGVKIGTLREVRRVLALEGSLHIADWGKPSNALMRALFFTVQLLDGFETTRDSVSGALPELLRAAGYVRVEETTTFDTPLGTMRLLRVT